MKVCSYRSCFSFRTNVYLKISTELTRVFLIIEKSDLDVKEKLKRIDKGDYYSVCLECMDDALRSCLK